MADHNVSGLNEIQLMRRSKALSRIGKKLGEALGSVVDDVDDAALQGLAWGDILACLDEAYDQGFADAQNETKDSIRLDYK